MIEPSLRIGGRDAPRRTTTSIARPAETPTPENTTTNVLQRRHALNQFISEALVAPPTVMREARPPKRPLAALVREISYAREGLVGMACSTLTERFRRLSSR